MSDEDKQRADHYQYLYEQASEGRCGPSGLTIPACKASICDCFEFPWVEPDKAAADEAFGVTPEDREMWEKVDAALAACCEGHLRGGVCYNDPEDEL